MNNIMAIFYLNLALNYSQSTQQQAKPQATTTQLIANKNNILNQDSSITCEHKSHGGGLNFYTPKIANIIKNVVFMQQKTPAIVLEFWRK
ncbi:MAG: hypothetical protein K2Y14_10575 [Burkholderiales bacterium]|nr:hypothetical protein [Burkholderiales bacterium]